MEALAPILARLLLDEDSLDLIATMAPDELVQLTVLSIKPPEVGRWFRDAGIDVLDVGESSTLVEGRLDQLLRLSVDLRAMGILVRDSDRALRPIPADRPAVAIPQPGQPYVGGFGGLEMPEVEMPEPQRTTMLGSMGTSIVTIDGQPYRQAEVSAGCERQGGALACTISVSGRVRGGGIAYDDWSATGTPATGWRAQLDRSQLNGVPRPLLRAAEWVARHDEATLVRIGGYTTCCGASWDPEHPGQITLTYLRPCHEAVAEPGRAIASTGDCFETLRVLVDLGATKVLAVEDRPGP